MKSIDEQIDVMAEKWPQFEVRERAVRGVYWVGSLKPNSTKYTVGIRYNAPLAIHILDPYRFQPRVTVLDPLLQRHPKTGARIPHVYTNNLSHDHPYLCLFDPDAQEWSPFSLIATTTVPWTSLHLHYYEGWLLTGKWLGPERHPEGDDVKSNDKRPPAVRRNFADSPITEILARVKAI